MATDLRDKLRQLGVTKGTASIQLSARPRERRHHPIESLVNGQEVESSLGRTFVVEERYALDYVQGNVALGLLLKQSAAVAAQLGRDPRLSNVDLSRCVFLDTETTGLAGGAGTLAFMVGIGSFENAPGRGFYVCQFFLRDPDEEAAMLASLLERMDEYEAIVTFNGRGFDLPLLQARYTLARMQPRWFALPHLDLLAPARRLWRDRLSSCALSSLEARVLDVQRAQDDVPGYLIPQMYLEYLRTGDAREMLRVMYHNRQDILSMVTLATLLCRAFAGPWTDASLDPADLVSLGKWYDDLGMDDWVERAFRSALECELPPSLRAAALARWGLVLKRRNRQQAAAVWKQLTEVDSTSVTAHVELAKHYEWYVGDLKQALTWTRAALKVVAAWPPGDARDQARAELDHRRQRLERKHAGKM